MAHSFWETECHPNTSRFRQHSLPWMVLVTVPGQVLVGYHRKSPQQRATWRSSGYPYQCSVTAQALPKLQEKQGRPLCNRIQSCHCGPDHLMLQSLLGAGDNGKSTDADADHAADAVASALGSSQPAERCGVVAGVISATTACAASACENAGAGAGS
jgi:hypothetical protein